MENLEDHLDPRALSVDNIEHFHGLGLAGIDWSKIVTWIMTYGLPLLLKILPLIAPFLKSGKLDSATLEAWIEAALAALKNGEPVPALP